MPTDNGFLSHNITHLSPSSLNLSMGSMSAWCVRYLLGERFPSGFAAERGKASEVGVSHGIFTGAGDAECIELALETYARATEENIFANVDALEKEKNAIIGMVPLALEALRPYGVPTPAPEGSAQHEVGIACRFQEGDQGTVHVKGFLDFFYEDVPLVIDLKTTLRAPSEFSQAHSIQAAIYSVAKKCPVKFLYATPKKIVWLENTPEQQQASLDLVKSTVRRLNNFLSLSADPQALTRSASHDPSTFYWKGAENLLALLE